MFYVYILKCNNGAYYVGHTDDLETRIQQHNTGEFEGYTASRLPVELVFSDSFDSRNAAFYVEQQIKRWSRIKKEALIKGDFKLLSAKAKKIF